MKRTTLYVCETPFSRNEKWVRDSMRPFLAGLCEIHDVRLLYRTFTQAAELKSLLSRDELPRADGQRVLLYVNAHGSGGRVMTDSERAINLKNVAANMAHHVEGVWLGACDVGASGAMESFLLNGKATWAGGFTCAVKWEQSILIDTAVMQAAISERSPKSSRQVARIFGRALSVFSPEWIIDEDKGKPLSEAVRFWGRDHRKGPTTADITQEIQRWANWPTEESNT